MIDTTPDTQFGPGAPNTVTNAQKTLRGRSSNISFEGGISK